MSAIPGSAHKQNSGSSKKNTAHASEHSLHHLAFDSAAQANIISIVSSGKIVAANKAASQLLGYSKKELLTKSRGDIFDINESSF